MGRALPDIDESVWWPRCRRCNFRHTAAVACPPADVWLVAWSKRINGVRR